ncbi:WYL domain-containing protein [Streptomyces altiplanensis]
MLGLSEDASRALVTLEQAAPAAPRAAMGAVRLTRPHNHGESLAPPIAPSALTAVGTAARHRHVLVIETPRADGSRPAPGEDGFLPVRRVEPYHLVVRAGRWCLVAYDLEDRQWRVLRVGRLRPRPITQCSSPRELAQACRRLVHRWAAIAGTGHAPAPPP